MRKGPDGKKKTIPTQGYFCSNPLCHYTPFAMLRAGFGEWVKPNEQANPIWNIFADFAYAQVIKQQRRFRLIKVEYRNIGGTAAEYAARFKASGLNGNINTPLSNVLI